MATPRKVPPRRTQRESIISSSLKAAGYVVATLGLIIGTAIGVDDRYAHAADVRSLSQQLEVNRLTAEVAVLEIRRSTLQDRVYEGRSRNLRSRSEIEILDRYQRELTDVDRQITEKRRQITEMSIRSR